MSGSFVIYRGRDFEANDVLLQIWLYLVLTEARPDADLSEWTRELVNDWSDVSTSAAVGTVFPRLDHFAEKEEHRRTLITYCERALDRLKQQTTLSKETLKQYGIGGKRIEFVYDIGAEKVLKVAEPFMHLLKEEPLGEAN